MSVDSSGTQGNLLGIMSHCERGDEYIRLRRATEEIITKIKYMNRVAVTMRHGMLDSEGASQELELIQKQIEEIVKTLPFHAGIEEGA